MEEFLLFQQSNDLNAEEQIELLNEISSRLIDVNDQLWQISIFLQVAIYLVLLGACVYLAWLLYRLLVKPVLRSYLKFPL